MPDDKPRLFADTIAPVVRTAPDELFLLTIEAVPDPDSDEAADTGGAYVNCWADAGDLRAAELRAVALIEEAGWRPVRLDDWSLVSDAFYADAEPTEDGVDYRELVAEARRDGYALVFNMWPADAEDADDDPS